MSSINKELDNLSSRRRVVKLKDISKDFFRKSTEHTITKKLMSDTERALFNRIIKNQKRNAFKNLKLVLSIGYKKRMNFQSSH